MSVYSGFVCLFSNFFPDEENLYGSKFYGHGIFVLWVSDQY